MNAYKYVPMFSCHINGDRAVFDIKEEIKGDDICTHLAKFCNSAMMGLRASSSSVVQLEKIIYDELHYLVSRDSLYKDFNGTWVYSKEKRDGFSESYDELMYSWKEQEEMFDNGDFEL